MTRLLLVRHGESTWNAAGRWQGRADPPLSPRGEAQAVAAGPAVAALLGPPRAPRTTACSPLRRARRTAEVLARAAALLAPVGHDGLQERGAGPWTGLTHAEIDAGWPGDRRDGRRPEGFEADAPLLARARTALADVARAAAGEPALVVAHEGVIRALERAAGHDDGKLVNLGARWFAPRDGAWAPDGPRLALLPAAWSSPGDPAEVA